MLYSKKLIEKILPDFKKKSNKDFVDAVASTGNELPDKDIFFHPKLNNLVVGKIISFEPIPSTHLNYCKVQIDKKGTVRNIICGASNVTKGKLVIVALEKAVLYDGRVIEKKEIKGYKSEGMLCGYSELTPLNSKTISKYDNEGIILLEEKDIKIGDDVKKITSLLGLDDVIYDIEVPFSNRHDIQGLLCFLQDIAGYFKMNYSLPKISFSKKTITNSISFDKKICNGYCLIKIEKVKIEESCWEVKRYLMNNGIKPINNILDTLNIVTLLTNVPTAVYDADLVKNIDVQYAKKGEKFTGFNEKQYILSDSDIVIRNEKKDIICLAGILGDNKYGLTNGTKNILIEVANFDFVSIRETAKKFDIQTDAASRMSKKIPNYTTLLAASLIQEVFAKYGIGKYVGNKTKCEEEKIKPISINEKYISSILGTSVSKKEIASYLQWFGFKITNNLILPPPFRTDIENDQDISEEIIKSMHVNDYDEEPISSSSYKNEKYNEWYFMKNINRVMTDSYFNETITINMVSAENKDKFNFFNIKNINVSTSLNSDKAFLRTSTIHQMLTSYKHNLSYKNPIYPIYELQKIYDRNLTSFWTLNVVTPAIYKFDKVNSSQIVYNTNTLISLIQSIGDIFKQRLTFKLHPKSDYFYNNESLSVEFEGKTIGFIGSIKKTILKQYDIDQPIYCAFIDWKPLYLSYKPSSFVLNSVPSTKLMNISKDLSFIVKKDLHLSSALDQAKKLDFVKQIQFLDYFKKSDDSFSYTLRFFFDESSSYTNDQITNILDQIIKIFAKHELELNN